METVPREDGTETRLEPNNREHDKNKMFQHKKVETQRISLSIKEKRAIIEKYDMLPDSMPKNKKAEILGLKYTTLLHILPQRDKIFSMKNTAARRARPGKEEEVGLATLKWLQYARARNEEVTQAMIQRKASEIARRMGKDFMPLKSWVTSLCRRGNISLKKDASPKNYEAVEKTVSTYEAMESLDVVYNFLIQNNGSQSALNALEEILSFVDGKHNKKACGTEKADKSLSKSFEEKGEGSAQDINVKEEVLDVEAGLIEDSFDLEMDNAENDEDANPEKDPESEEEDVDFDNSEMSREKCSNSSDDEPQIDPLSYLSQEHVENAHAFTLSDTLFERSEVGTSQGQVRTRISYSIQEKQDIIKRYDLLPKMSNQKKAKMLGVKYSSLLNIVSQREKIFSIQNTAMKRARHGKEKEVGDAVLKWIQSARERNEEISMTIIRVKTSEIAREMGRDFSPSMGWVSRLCKRGNINLKKGDPGNVSTFLDVSFTDDNTEANSW